MGVNANFAATPRQGLAQVTSANPNRDGTGILVDVFVAGANGSRIDKVGYHATVSTSAGMVRWFVNDGTNTRLVYEQSVLSNVVTATNGATSVTNPSLELGNGASGPFPMVLPSGWRLRASTEIANAINVWAQGGDF